MSGGPSHGVSRSRPFDRWFRYPAGFSASTLETALEAVGDGSEAELVVDPFAGSGSVGTATLGRGRSYVGIEAHPLIAELAHLKLVRPGEPEELVEFARQIAAAAPPGEISAEPNLVRRCFDQWTLASLIGIRETLSSHADSAWAGHAKWALLGTLRDVADVKVGWPYQRPGQRRLPPHRDAMKRFVQRAAMMADDLSGAPDAAGDRVIAGDSRSPSTWAAALGARPAAACITSPPYLNNFDYADATRLEVYFLGAASSWAELCGIIRAEMLVATTQQTRVALARRADEELSGYPNTYPALRQPIERLAIERNRRARGKEYDRVLAPYFLGLARVLAALHKHLAPRAKAAWIIGDSAPYGIYVDTPSIVLGLAEDLGFRAIADVSLRTRGERWRTNGTRHQVKLSERLITFARPPEVESDCAHER